MRAAIYTRVSSEEQLQGHSLEAQQQAIEAFCRLRNYTIVLRYEERGRSGTNALRPEFQRMIADAEARAFDVIVVHKLDRFSRSLVDTLSYLGKLEKAGVSFTSATEPFDFTSAFGKLMLAILGAFAQWYLDNLRTEVAKGKRARAAKGLHNGRLSYGYTTPKRLESDLIALGEQMKAGTLDEGDYSLRCHAIEQALAAAEGQHETAAVPDPTAADGVRLAFTLYASGRYSHSEIARALNEAGYRSNGTGSDRTLFTSATISDMLKNRFYIGLTAYGAGARGHERRAADLDWVQGTHVAIVSQELFEAVQRVRDERADRLGTSFTWHNRQVRTYPLAGLLTCPHCGNAFRGKWNSGRRTYWHYDGGNPCTHRPRYISADEIDQAIGELLSEVHLPEDWRTLLKARLADESRAEHRQGQGDTTALQTRLERLKQLYVLGDLSLDEYMVQSTGIKAQILQLDPKPPRADVRDFEHVALLMSNMKQAWGFATAEEKKELANMLLKRVYTAGGQIKAIEPTPLMWVLLDAVRPLAGRMRANPNVSLPQNPLNTFAISPFLNV